MFCIPMLAAALAAPSPSVGRRILQENGETPPPSQPEPAPRRPSPLPSAGPSEGFSAFGATPDTAARDSIAYAADEIDYDVSARTIVLLGNARVQYGGMTLTAHRIRFITQHDLVIAEGYALPDYPDSIVGIPRFSSGVESFTGTRMSYNIRTQRGLVEGGYSAVPEGIYGGRLVKRTGEEQVDVFHGVYTTCDHNPPHYVFEGREMRILMGDKVVAKPVVLKVADVPIFWIPFGVFFINKDRRSGFLSPRMGENQFAGRYMRGLGYYFAPNDYFGSQAVLSVDERIGYEWRVRTEYALRYRLRGAVSANFSKDWGTELQEGRRVWTLNAQHQQELSPRSSLSANINYTSSTTPRSTASTTQASVLNQVFTSTLGYTQSWESGYSVRADFRSSQNLQNRQLDQVLPSLSLNSGQRYFFSEPKRRGPRAQKPPEEPPWYRRLGYSWNWSGTNTRTRGPSDRTIFDTWELHEARGDSVIAYLLTITRTYTGTTYDGTYVVAIEDGGRVSEGLLRLTDDPNRVELLSPDLGVQSGWAVMSGNDLRVKEPTIAQEVLWRRRLVPDVYTQTTSQGANLSLPLPTPRWLNVTPSLAWHGTWTSRPDPDRPEDPQTRHTLTSGISSNATFYGLFPVNKGPVVAFRHVVTPSLGISYRITRETRGGSYLFGGRSVGGDTSRVVDMNLRNVFQMKARWRGQERKFDQLLTVATGVTYNRDAVGRRWSDPSTSVQLQPSDFFVVRMSMVHTLYESLFDSAANRWRDRLAWAHPALKSLAINTSLRLAGGGGEPANLGEEGFASQQQEPVDSRGLEQRPLGAGSRRSQAGSRGFGWQVNLRHTYQWSRREPGYSRSPEPVNQLDLSFAFSPWRDWHVEATTKYDIRRNRREGDTINITRTLHCWEAQLNWVVRGPFKGYYFRINIIGLPDVKIESASESQRMFR